MKKPFYLLSLFILLLSCEVEGELTRDAVNVAPPASSPTLAQGTFTPSPGIRVTGLAKIVFNGIQNEVRLENFSVSSGPDLKVYLSRGNTPSDFVNLGNLTSATAYFIPVQVNTNDYKYVLIHCQQYNHLFAVAALSN
ncbi:DM13 domain-containing protein [Flavobacterium sp. K77]|uniref:DM13 domain-containing protein n=1 Tax=Flavobacterium sp. K77 TaxID=2910676 RepID=UPI001F1A2A90|nr:DM13 domain-containing protein [Flavobacterium sp. K77]MCF6142382.1 DM13 domain-containing protein [Flavobacterium sp. K77]